MSQPDSVTSFKRRAYMDYIRDGQGSIVSYYVLTKTHGGKAPVRSRKTRRIPNIMRL